MTPRRPDIVFFPANPRYRGDCLLSESFPLADTHALDILYAVSAAPGSLAPIRTTLFVSDDEIDWRSIGPSFDCSGPSETQARVAVEGWRFIRAEATVPTEAEGIPVMLGYAAARSEAA